MNRSTARSPARVKKMREIVAIVLLVLVAVTLGKKKAVAQTSDLTPLPGETPSSSYAWAGPGTAERKATPISSVPLSNPSFSYPASVQSVIGKYTIQGSGVSAGSKAVGMLVGTLALKANPLISTFVTAATVAANHAASVLDQIKRPDINDVIKDQFQDWVNANKESLLALGVKQPAITPAKGALASGFVDDILYYSGDYFFDSEHNLIRTKLPGTEQDVIQPMPYWQQKWKAADDWNRSPYNTDFSPTPLVPASQWAYWNEHQNVYQKLNWLKTPDNLSAVLKASILKNS